MSLQLIAKQMEAKGRGGDSVLVHMTPGEVEGLQKLAEAAGGSLSVNPETGLVEANFLKRMLPTLVGVGVGMFAGPMAGAAAGALVGGATAPKDQREMGILMGALGGYGGAGIGAGLGAAGSTAAQAAAMNTAATAGQAANLGTAAGVGSAMPSGLVGAGAEGVIGDAVAKEAANATLQQELKAQAINQAAEAEAKRFAAQGVGARTGQGISALMDQSTNVGRDAFFSKVGMKELGMAAAPLMVEDRRQAEVPTDDEMYVYDFDYGRTGADSMPTDSSAERMYFNPTFSNRRKKPASEYFNAAEGGEVAGSGVPSGTYAGGGLMGLAKGGMKSGGFVVPADVVSMIGEGNTDAGYSRIKSMVPGATAIKGKDGGQADTVKTSIEGKQPARVAHGEMYIPPETVKRMGGAKKLYAMMDRVREQATGSKKQIKPVSLKQAMA
jgi:hypothetical protein